METTLVKTFENSDFGKVRVIMIDDEPWFVGKDIAKTLGYKRPNDAINAHVPLSERKIVNFNNYVADNTTVKRRGNPNQLIIDLSGLLRLIFESELPIAEMFKDWILKKVLPRLFELGKYLSTTINPAALPAPEQTVETIDVTPSDQ